MSERTVYEMVGGMETFRALASAFYRGVAADPLLRPMYVESLEEAADKLALFLAQYFGGPQEYSAQRGHPRLRMRHVPFRIGQAERDAWLKNMLAAIDEVGIAEPMRSPMRHYFEQTSTFLINTP